MKPKPTATNSTVLTAELQWLNQVISTRFNLYFGIPGPYESIAAVPVPDLATAPSAYAALVRELALSPTERLVLALALAPHVQPQVLDAFFVRNTVFDRPYTEFGGIKGKNHGGFLPTGETALFLLADNLAERLHWQTYLWQDSALTRACLVQLGSVEAGEPATSRALTIPTDQLALLLTGQPADPTYNSDFPARRMSTPLAWSDLVLPQPALEEVEELHTWLENQHQLLADEHLSHHLKPGYRALFYGPPGTGKTLTAGLLGKASGRPVYRVDLSMVVSKYIGETEKNLSRVFDKAERQQWILFFDEADALFGKRSTAVSSSNDRHANQETAYLLQRIEDFPGLIILAFNVAATLDEAFAWRFQALIHFPMPAPAERLRLWQQAFTGSIKLPADVDLADIAEKYALTGGSIINVLRYCVLAGLHHNRPVSLTDIKKGIQRELDKQAKTT